MKNLPDKIYVRNDAKFTFGEDICHLDENDVSYTRTDSLEALKKKLIDMRKDFIGDRHLVLGVKMNALIDELQR